MANTTEGAATTPAPQQTPPVTAPVTTSAKVSYPRIENKSIRIVHKNLKTILPEEGTAYNTAEDYTSVIGGSFAGHNDPRQLGRVIWKDQEEESRIMGIILAADSKHPDWNKLLNEYWNNYRVVVPHSGIELEIGMIYNSEEDPGTPIRPTDYVLWRYCLLYRGVANDPADAWKSVNIRFILVSEVEELKRQTQSIDLKDQATVLRLELAKDETRARAVLSVLGKNPEVTQTQLRIQLAELSEQKPQQFIVACNDRDLIDKAFLQACLRYGIIKQPENSEMLIYNETQSLGNMNNAVAFINDPANGAVRVELDAKLSKFRTTK